MKKVEILHLDFQNGKDNYTPVFCPFTGKPLQVDDTPVDNSDDYPESVVMSFATDFIADGPFTIVKEFEPVYNELCEKFEIEDEASLVNALNILDDPFGYVVLICGQYGVMPGDFGSTTFVLRKEKCFLR